jgi:hypothetical protein
MYRELHDAFGGVAGARGEFGTIMKRLLALRQRVGESRELPESPKLPGLPKLAVN